MQEQVKLIDVTKQLVDKFNRFTIDKPIEFEVKETIQSPTGVRQYIQLYGPTTEDGHLMDLQKIIVAEDIEENQNEKVQQVISHMVGILTIKITEQTDPYIILSNAIKYYDDVKRNMEVILNYMETEVPEMFTESLNMWNVFQRVYDWVQTNEQYVILDGTVELVERTPRLPKQIFERLMNEYLDASISVLLVDLIPLTEED